MYLKKIFSEPSGLFPPVDFINGVNFIFGKKENEVTPKHSLNSIGKSTFLDLIDFCLLASYKKIHNPRLLAAHDILSGYEIVLEFSIEETVYRLTRNVDEPQIVHFGSPDKLEKYDLENLKPILGDLIFKRKAYSGFFNPKWFRPLINFYTKIQKFKREQFLDPIKYIKEISELEINIFQFYLLDLNDKLLIDNYRHYGEYKKIVPALQQVRKLISEKYDLTNIKQTNESISKLRLEIVRLDEAIQKFELMDQYRNSEDEANELTFKIKELWLQNFSERKKIDQYEESFKVPDKISTTKIKNIYSQLSENFGIQVKKSLDDAIKFRDKLSESRRNFLLEEITNINIKIKEREIEIKLLEDQRAKILGFLATQDAIKDFTEAYSIVNLKRAQLSDLESNVNVINELDNEKSQIETEIVKVKGEIINQVNDINNISKSIIDLYNLFMEIYNTIYINNKNQSKFSISYNNRKKQVVEINVTTPDMFGKGKNQGRTLIYDLFILILNMSKESNFPRFLIHDGIFDGVDKSHFLAVDQYLTSLANRGYPIQYITTINEEGTLTDKFGEQSSNYDPAEIEKRAVLVLSSENKLFKKDFDNN
ncbi:DUF2326 domain-containing protein [Mucilaginibacter sp. HMF5004]|uniref:DUF2326 domain-containing protein n=1 Tax=Mucilaginibacter rivuli TaxID=2857527 RepID=UPI001C5CFD1E|nr:DUF2326 domain-containing protein [Mucilaginibacter rivuli]MBW4890222.1 DUF2326 domain-containing protein [Mucilaginibacter rivuli]